MTLLSGRKQILSVFFYFVPQLIVAADIMFESLLGHSISNQPMVIDDSVSEKNWLFSGHL